MRRFGDEVGSAKGIFLPKQGGYRTQTGPPKVTAGDQMTRNDNMCGITARRTVCAGIDQTLMLLEHMFWYNAHMEKYAHPSMEQGRMMDNPLQLTPRQLHLVIAPHRAQRQMMTILTARLALNGRVRLVDAGNCFDGYGLARQIRQQTSHWQQALERVSVARAFTCYQVETLLSESVADLAPVLVLNLLDTFYDENVKLVERLRLLQVSLGEIRRLCRGASVAVSTCQTLPNQPGELLEMLEGAAAQVWSYEEPQPAEPLRLF